MFWHADVPRMQEARYVGACLGVHYWPVETEAGWRETLRQIAEVDLLASQPGCIRVRSARDWVTAAQSGLLALAPGVEGAHMLNGRLERVRELAAHRVAYLTLAHFSRNAAATPSMGRGADERSGLTTFGRALVRELNRWGVAVDVSHVNRAGTMDAIRAATAPVLCTHSGMYSVRKHPRLLHDEAAVAIAETGGAVGILFAPHFLAGKLNVDSSCVLDHIDYLLALVGPNHVVIGSDYDGWLPRIPNDMRDCRDLVVLVDGLLRRGHAVTTIESMLCRNVHRVFAAIEAAAEEPRDEAANSSVA